MKLGLGLTALLAGAAALGMSLSPSTTLDDGSDKVGTSEFSCEGGREVSKTPMRWCTTPVQTVYLSPNAD